MKKLLAALVLLLLITPTFGQEEERFTLEGKAKLITTWQSKSLKSVDAKLSSGDAIRIILIPQNDAASIQAYHKNLVADLGEIDYSDDLQDWVVKIYEYDFDRDGEKELIIAKSFDFSFLTVEVYRYSNGLATRVGNFNAQFTIILDKNNISFPIGSQGYVEEFFYRDGIFYEPVPHNPDNNDQ